MKFVCEQCGEVDHVLMDGYGVGDRLLEGVMFKITIKKENLIAHVQDEDKSYFTNNHISIKKWEKEMTDDAKESYENDGCCLMVCPRCEQDQVINIER